LTITPHNTECKGENRNEYVQRKVSRLALGHGGAESGEKKQFKGETKYKGRELGLKGKGRRLFSVRRSERIKRLAWGSVRAKRGLRSLSLGGEYFRSKRISRLSKRTSYDVRETWSNDWRLNLADAGGHYFGTLVRGS